MLALAVAALVGLGYEWRAIAAQRDEARQQATQAAQLAKQSQAARAVELAVAVSDAAASTDYQKGVEDGKQELVAAIDRLRVTLRLREQQLADARRLPAAAAGSSGRDASAPADFLTAHGEDALRLAAEADDVVRQLSTCQMILQADRSISILP